MACFNKGQANTILFQINDGKSIVEKQQIHETHLNIEMCVPDNNLMIKNKNLKFQCQVLPSDHFEGKLDGVFFFMK